ncbi:alpha/beta hydrolase [Zobellia uliginosa]|uniref:alpha/beta hydrolase n=1 Tax=Zobellia uliginosa TaxID=143224 RepID=UPI0026E163E4|nr:alpha/beta hydrolase-fold protein [Zobellia uliginosa]MDO6517721.1 alpha/beta hydrolase-fold protein [Zobellia uliginosa]
MKKTLVLALFFITAFSFAQTIEIGVKNSIRSTSLNEDREYWVYLPENYGNEHYADQHYPVIYVLDGEKYFHVISGMVKNLSDGYYPLIPECIVVAIKNTNRSRDLTPTVDDSLSYETGGANAFEAFIAKELIPEINTRYRTLDYKVLVGHSFGGLFTMNTLVGNTALFNAYIVIDPSLWWDDKRYIKELDHHLKSIDFEKRSLFFADANSIGNQKKPSPQHYDHFEAKKMAIEKMTLNPPKNLSLNMAPYENEDHGSVVLPAFIDGLRYIFEGYRIDVKELMKKPGLLQGHYKLFSDRIGFDFIPQSTYIDRVVDLLVKRGDTTKSKLLHQINIELHPGNSYLKHKDPFTKKE